MHSEEQFEIAVAALERLEAIHGDFMRAAAVLKEPKVNGAEFGVTENELYAMCLNVELKTKHRPIALDGKLGAIEYAFVASVGDKDIPVWAMFLFPDGSLYADASAADVICQSQNAYLPSRVAPRLASALLKTTIFAPTK